MISGLKAGSNEERRHELGLQKLEEQRVRGDMIECFKICENLRIYSIQAEGWFKDVEHGTRSQMTK